MHSRVRPVFHQIVSLQLDSICPQKSQHSVPTPHLTVLALTITKFTFTIHCSLLSLVPFLVMTNVSWL